MKHIKVRGARQHNLKNIDIDLPRDKLVVITGLSGSGKSSLAFDTLYAEGQRRYVESLSAYARQFLSMMEKPDVDHIEGLSPAISIEQKTTSHNPRSTVGTVTEIYDYLRLLFARAGTPICPDHNLSLEGQTSNQICDKILELPKESKLMILAPLIKEQKGEHLHVFDELKMQGYVRMRVNGITVDVDDSPKLNKNKKHSIEAVVDRLVLPKEVDENFQLRLAESVENALNLSDGNVIIFLLDKNEDITYSAKMACNECGYSIPELEPRLFTFNNPAGACPDCEGLGVKQYVDVSKVIHEPTASLSEGAVVGWDISHRYHFHLFRCLSKEYKFSLDEPYENLNDEIKNLILNGSQGMPVNFSWRNKRGSLVERIFPFEGVLSNIERRYKETESSWSRDNLSKLISLSSCKACAGTRLRKEARNVFIEEVNLPDITSYTIDQAFKFFSTMKLKGSKKEIAERIVKEVNERLEFLIDVGLNYLTLDRSAESLSGGEAQRIRLASQIGAGLVGVTYILDEPSIGLHQRDNEKLLKTLKKLRDLGNTVIVVEHDHETMQSSDHIVDIGPGAGVHGGKICAQGTAKEIATSKDSITGQYLSGTRQIEIPKKRKKFDKERLIKLTKAEGHNLKSVNLELPLDLFVCITGVSGSGKSTLINQTLLPAISNEISRAEKRDAKSFSKLTGIQDIDKIIEISQSPIGRTPRSNPATYTGLFTPLRELFAGTQESRSRGYKIGRFSFNVKGGRCEACQGDGVIKVEMHFLPDVYVKCDVCDGHRYNRETLDIKYKGKNIYEVLDMTVEDSIQFFDSIPSIRRKLETLMDVGLGYVKLGQQATTLSGGEAQRVKLAKELSKSASNHTLYILDEPTTGLHMFDVDLLLKVLRRLRDNGNTVVVIEHNMDVIKTCDWIIDLGPEGGSNGGEIVASGTPEELSKNKKSHTGMHLVKELKG
ncbi:excinuclease ABC subunit UvrA [Gammaproteobacteria bacterium]|jgi:excinuclease ABC subunit A|nr:excinuclease ABC subunit UvrA [Gammaproteobacteria bacterium]